MRSIETSPSVSLTQMAKRLSLLLKYIFQHDHLTLVSVRPTLKSLLHSMAAEVVEEKMASPPANIDQHPSAQPMTFMPSVRAASEKKFGLLNHVSSARDGWHGEVRKRQDNLISLNPPPPSLSFLSPPPIPLLKQDELLTQARFTDFMVNEIRRDGQVLHLEDFSLSERPTDVVCSALSILWRHLTYRD